METPEVIYLIPEDLDRGEYVWCDDPAPGLDMEPEDSVKYIRDDIANHKKTCCLFCASQHELRPYDKYCGKCGRAFDR